MAEPKTEIDRRLDRIEEAIREITKLFGREDVHNHIEKILRREEPKEEENGSEN